MNNSFKVIYQIETHASVELSGNFKFSFSMKNNHIENVLKTVSMKLDELYPCEHS